MNLGFQASSLGFNVAVFVVSSAVVWFAGNRLARYAKTISERTRFGEVFIGTLLLGAVVSLPEAVMSLTSAAMGNAQLAVNTLLGGIVFSIFIVASAARLEQYEMVFSDAFGTSLFSVMLLFFCDVAFPGGPVLNEVGPFSLFATLLGAAVTAVYVAGLIGRPRKVVLRMGIDSVLVLGMSVGGTLLLSRLR